MFVPSGGVKGVPPIVSILTATDDALPYVVLDSDGPGEDMRKKLLSGLYQGQATRILRVGDICTMQSAETEDLFPAQFLASEITKYLRGPEEEFSEVLEEGRPIVPQVEEYAQRHGLTLELGWKVDIAKRAKARLLKARGPIKDDAETLEWWKTLFEQLQETSEQKRS